MPAIEKPLVAMDQEAFGSAYPTSDAYPTDGGVFKVVGVDNAYDCPCEMVSIATTKEDMPKITRHWSAWDGEMPDDNLNQPY